MKVNNRFVSLLSGVLFLQISISGIVSKLDQVKVRDYVLYTRL